MANLVNKGDAIKKAHITTLQTNFKTIVEAVTFPEQYSVSFTTPGEKATANLVTELRTKINELEMKFSGNCNCTDCWQCNCCQTCQSSKCQSQCKTSCQSECTTNS